MIYSSYNCAGYVPKGQSMTHIAAVMQEPDKWVSEHSYSEIGAAESYARGIVGIWKNCSPTMKNERLRGGFQIECFELCDAYLQLLEKLKKNASKWHK